MPDFVRVTDLATGHKYTVTREKFDLNPSLYRELKQPATAPSGRPLPVDYKTPDATASDKQAGSSANTEKENR